MKLSKNLVLVVLLFVGVQLFAQEKTVTGKVTGPDNVPIPGVNVIVVDTDRGTLTDFDGSYQLSVNPGEILRFSYVGFLVQEVTVANQDQINVVLDVDNNQLEEVVIVGYGTRKKVHMTGAVASVSNEDLDQIPVARVDDALVGQIAGVNIAATEGEAGSAPTIRIRGVGSLNGDSAPLIVVDGLPVDNDFLGSLDMNEVESFDVLKDAASSAIYGSRGSNGVILITTKTGEAGETKFSYNSYIGQKEARQSEAYYFSVAETAAAELAATGSISPQTEYKQLIGIDRDWQDVIFDGGMIQSHSLSARGGNEKTKFSASLGYLADEGVLLTDDFKRYNARLKIDTKVNKQFKFGANLAPSYSVRRRFDGSTHDILRQTPWLPVYHDENTIQYVDRNKYPDVQVGDYALQRHFDNYDLYGNGSDVDISNTSNTNPAAKVLERERYDKKFKLAGSFYAQFKLNDDLNFRTVLSGDYQNTFRDRWQGVESNRNGASAASYNLSNENRFHLVTENYFSYDKVIGDHDISAIAGFSAEKWNWQGDSAAGSGYSSDLLKTLSAATVITSIGSYKLAESFESFYGRFNYAYNDKYLASLSFRRDGSSIFGVDKKFGNFPAASLGWRVSEEDFLKDNDMLSYLKLRASYGFTGNKDINTGSSIVDLYPSIPLLGTGVYNSQSAFVALNIQNPSLQWERLEEFNPGVDFGLFEGVISGSFDYYTRISDNLLLYNPISTTTGFDSALVNLGEVKNSGYELELRTRNVNSDKFKWTTTALASFNKNELTDFADADGQIQSVDAKRAAEWINSVGNPISSFYGWVVDSEIPLEYIKNPYHPVGATAQDVYVKDLNGDGLIDDDDKTILGSPYPDLVWSVTNDFSIGDFGMSFLFQGSHGAEVRNMGDQYLFNQFNSRQDFDPSITPNQGFIKQKIFTNSIIQDASYISLRNVNISYNLPKELTEKFNLSSMKVYLTGQNLMYKTADGYTGFNPESINDTSPTTYGYQRAGSPIFSTISLGTNIEF